MKESKVCPKCGSREVMPNVTVLDQGEGSNRNLQVAVFRKPLAMFFKGAHTENVFAVICGQCGFTELYVHNPAELLSVFKQQDRA